MAFGWDEPWNFFRVGLLLVGIGLLIIVQPGQWFLDHVRPQSKPRHDRDYYSYKGGGVTIAIGVVIMAIDWFVD